MHPYSTDSSERYSVHAGLALVSVAAAWLLHTTAVGLHATLPWWVEVPSVMAFYGAGYQVVDRWLWKNRILHRVGLLRLPDLSGTWHGYVTSTFDEHARQHPATIEIRQTWTMIICALRTDRSESRSIAAALLIEEATGPLLSYEYLSEPRANAVETMQTHRGTARLGLQGGNGVDLLEGEYYAGRGRENQGIMRFERRRAKP